jgi:hypothetical protein
MSYEAGLLYHSRPVTLFEEEAGSQAGHFGAGQWRKASDYRPVPYD